MSLSDTEQHQRFRERVRQLIQDEVLPHVEAWEREQTLPRSLFKALGDAGITGLMVPPELGGSGLDYSYAVVVVEEFLGRRLASVSCSIQAQSNTVCPLILRHGTPEQHRIFLGPIARGEAVAGIAITEPTGGSDLMESLQCIAEDDGDHWVITGEKMFITNGPIADTLLLLARTSRAPGPLSMTLILFPTKTPGYEVVENMDKLGLRASPTGRLRFNGCRVPKSFTLGRVNHGYVHAAAALAEERLLIGVGAVALAQSALDETIGYLKGRIAGGQPLTKRQALRHELSHMAAQLEACRSFVYAVAHDVVQGRVDTVRTCFAKFHVVEVAQRIVRRCAQLHGSSGLCESSWSERAVRDARVLSVFAGSSETMRDLASAKLLPLMKRLAQGKGW